MSLPSDDFGAELKAALDRQANRAPSTDLTGGALREAGRLRTRRRVGRLVTVVAAAAVVVPVGARIVGDSPFDSSPAASSTVAVGGSTVAVDLADLELGDPPGIPYLRQDMYVVDGTAEQIQPIDGAATVDDVSQFVDGPVVWSRDHNGTLNFSTNGAASGIPRGSEASNPAVESWNGETLTAWAVSGVSAQGHPVAGDSVFYTDNLTGDLSHSQPTTARVRQVIGVRHGVAVFNALDGDTPVVERVDLVGGQSSPSRPWPNVVALSAIDRDFTLMAGRTTDMADKQQQCIAMMSYADASELWRSCSWRPVDFSPDGTLVYAVAAHEGEVDASRSAVMDAATGQIVQKFSTMGTFGRSSFDGDTSVDMVLVEDGQSAIARCSVAGSCELATEPLPDDAAAPTSLVYPYQLTANP